MKKLFAMLLALIMVLSLVACGGGSEGEGEVDGSGADVSTDGAPDIKIGAVYIGDENEGYTAAHMNGLKAAMANLGIPEDAYIEYTVIPEDNTCYDKCVDLAEEGCDVIFTNSYGHQTYTQQAAQEYPEIQFVALTGDLAALSGLANLKNAFPHTFESRYVSGVVAGMKLKELMDSGEVTDPHVGYVGAFPYAEVVSGYTAFFLGVRSIVPEAYMDVQYTNSWFDLTKEGEAANALIARGCVIISQHADSTGAPSACEAALAEGTTVYCVGYNIDMLSVAPTAALTSATNNWVKYYEYALTQVINGEDIMTDWSAGYADDAVAITDLGVSCAEGTAEKVAEVEAAIKDGSLQVFDTSTFTVGGEEVTTALALDTDGDWVNDTAEAIIDGAFIESYHRAAPYFALRIDGITELTSE